MGILIPLLYFILFVINGTYACLHISYCILSHMHTTEIDIVRLYLVKLKRARKVAMYLTLICVIVYTYGHYKLYIEQPNHEEDHGKNVKIVKL